MKQVTVWCVLAAAACAPVEPTPASTRMEDGSAGFPRTSPQGTVTIVVRDGTVGDVIAAFRAQVRSVRFELRGDGWPDDFRVKAFIVVDEPWRSALTAFAALIDGVVTEDTPGLMHLCRPPARLGGLRPNRVEDVVGSLARAMRVKIVLDESFVGTELMLSAPKCQCRQPDPEQSLKELVAMLGSAHLVKADDGVIHILPQSKSGPKQPPK